MSESDFQVSDPSFALFGADLPQLLAAGLIGWSKKPSAKLNVGICDDEGAIVWLDAPKPLISTHHHVAAVTDKHFH